MGEGRFRSDCLSPSWGLCFTSTEGSHNALTPHTKISGLIANSQGLCTAHAASSPQPPPGRSEGRPVRTGGMENPGLRLLTSLPSITGPGHGDSDLYQVQVPSLPLWQGEGHCPFGFGNGFEQSETCDSHTIVVSKWTF